MDVLERWFRDNGGYMHPAVHLARDDEHGGHIRTSSDLAPATHIMTVPYSLTLSCLNAMVDDRFPVFKESADSFTVEALGFFYLMTQCIHRDTSFWKPYLDTLPTPEEGFSTPFWFEDEELRWLEGTDLHPSFLARQEVWKRYWEDGMEVLRRKGVDSEPYTW